MKKHKDKKAHPDRKFPYAGYWLLFFVCIFINNACYEPKEDCLDIQAVNFEPVADEACPDCCEYPKIKLRFQHKVITVDTTLNLTYNTPYTLDGVNYFRIQDIRFFISNLHLIRPDDTEIGLTDSIEINILKADQTTEILKVEDNFALADRDDFNAATLGTYQTSGLFSGIRFTLGIEENVNRAEPSSFPDTHPLSIESDSSMYWNVDEGYIFNRIALFRDTLSANDTPFILEMGTSSFLQQLTLPYDFTINEGFDLSITLRIDYLKWFESVDILLDSEESMMEKIRNNTVNSFSLVEIE